MRKIRSFEQIMFGPSAKQIVSKMDQSQREFEQRQKAVWGRLVPEIAFVLLRCDAKRVRAGIHDIAGEALATYPDDFSTRFAGHRIPDSALVLMTLNEAKTRQWGYVAGDWFRGWRLTAKGLGFAKDVERRRAARKR
jgi:hypothetical protein